MGNQQGKLHNQNQSGRPKKAVHWKSAERPSPPGRPMLIPISDQQPDVVSLRWERPKHDGGSPINGYVVEHRRMGSPHWVRATPTPVTRCEASISGLEPGWRYQFRVFAENVVGRSDASELSDALTVTLQRTAICVPNFIQELQDREAVEDERIEFRVQVVGQPPPEINWFKDGYEIFSSRRTKIQNDNDVSVLVIHQVALTDEGEIKCTATNRAGHVVTKARLMVQAPPKIRLPRTYEDGLIVEAEEVLRLKVGIAGQPPPAITWLHEGEVVPNGGRFEIVNTERNSMLKIDNIQRMDRGEYSIRAWNRLGEDATSFLVTVTARPDPPGRVQLNMSFGRSATLSWTAPLDDGGCKIGYYIVEYFRVGWNVWLKAATTRSLSTTLHDLIEGSEYKFRVKAENPYGVSEPSEESDLLFIPDPKRGITKPKSETKLTEEKRKPTPPQRKTMSPSRPQQDAATETVRISPKSQRKPQPQLLETEDLQREMSYGTSNQMLKADTRKSPSLSANHADQAAQVKKPTFNLKEMPAPATKSPQRSPIAEPKTRTQFLQNLLPTKDKSPSPLTKKVPVVVREPEPDSETPVTPEPVRASLHRKRSLSPVRSTSEPRKSPTPPEPMKITPALQRSAEPVQLGVNQQVRRYSGHSLSPAKHVPSLAIAIATGTMGLGNNVNNNKNKNYGNGNGNGNENDKINVKANDNSNTNVNVDENAAGKTNVNTNGNRVANGTNKQNASTITNPTIQISAPPPSATRPPPPVIPLSIAEKQDDVHTSNEFMLVVFDKHSKVKDNDKQDSFELDLEDALQPPPISISSPDLASLEFTNLRTFALRRSVSSTELLYERAMARFYEAVELEEAEKARKRSASQDKDKERDREKVSSTTNMQSTFMRKRLGSMTEAERLSFEKRSELRRQSADIVQDFKPPTKWSSRENISHLKPLSRTTGMMLNQPQVSQEESDEVSDYQTHSAHNKTDGYEVGSDYTESTASTEEDSIEKFKMELMARTRSPSPPELETYHPRDMSAGVFTPYRAPTPDNAAVVLNRPMPLPDPDFVPKPILKRQSIDNSQEPVVEQNTASVVGEKKDIAKGIKSFFKRDKRSATEKNTEENANVSSGREKTNAAASVADAEAKRKIKEEEELKRREAERIMHEEALAAVDHYSDLVSQVSTRKYQTPLYLNRDELKKAAEKASQEADANDEDETDVEAHLRMQREHSPELGLVPPISNKPRLSISERGQMMFVRETSDLAVTKVKQVPDTPTTSEDNAPQFAPINSTSTATVVSETTVERPDSRGRTRIVKVKRIIKKRVPSGTRSRDTSLSRPPSSAASTQDIIEPAVESQAPVRRRVLSRTRASTGQSKSPGPLGRRPLPPAEPVLPPRELLLAYANSDVLQFNNREQLSEEAHEKVRSALSYSTDLILFVVACYVYLFKDARLVLPILALMIYRQFCEVINECIPSWMRRKKN